METRMALVEERIETLRTVTAAFGPTARQVIEATADLSIQAREIADIRQDLEQTEKRMVKSVERVEEACSAVGGKLDGFLERRTWSRTTIIVGCLGVAGTVGAVVLTHLLG